MITANVRSRMTLTTTILSLVALLSFQARERIEMN